MEKKGELTTQQIVGLIILIASFAIILFLLFRLNLGQETDKEICHNSVIMRSQNKLTSGSLDCKTNYICVLGGEDCEEFNPSKTIEVNLNKADAKETLEKALRDEMSDCWWMFGEGEIDYVGYSWLPDLVVGSKCAICSVIKFDEEISNAFNEINIGNQKIETKEKYYLITGMQGKGKYIEPVFVKSISEAGCKEIITKA